MTRHDHSPASDLQPILIPESLHLQAAMRILPAPPHEREITAKRFLAGIRTSGIRLDNLYGILDHAGEKPRVREACLAIEGPGRTAMLFISHPDPNGDESDSRAVQERASCISAATDCLDKRRVAISQALPEPHETWAIEACKAAGFTHVGELAYMELAIKQNPAKGKADLPEGIHVRPLQDDLEPGSPDHDRLKRVLDSSYLDTNDCPELCGLRDTDDVIESHKATGLFDPSSWLLAFRDQQPVGCVLVSVVPETGSAELVYIGLAVEGRGMGLGKALLRRAIEDLRDKRIGKLVCAVDRRNSPALAMYDAFGFNEFSARDAWVKPNM
ncbi:MAG: hypothetical protein Phyf2KO_20230 [Phycisphaerales bacterium]